MNKLDNLWSMLTALAIFLFCFVTCLIDYGQNQRLKKLEQNNIKPLPTIVNLPPLDLSPYYLLKEKPITLPNLDLTHYYLLP